MGAAAPPRDPRSNLRESRGRAALAAAVCVALVLALNVSTQLQKRGEHIGILPKDADLKQQLNVLLSYPSAVCRPANPHRHPCG